MYIRNSYDKTIRSLKRNITDEFVMVPQKHLFADVLYNRCSYKFRNIHRKTPVLESHFNKVAGLRPVILLKRGQHRCFPVNIAKFARTALSTEHLWWLLLVLSQFRTFYPLFL